MKEIITIPPAQLWIGASALLNTQVLSYLQRMFCITQGCRICKICTSIAHQQYASCLWFKPENSYTLDLLKPFFSTLSQALDHDQKFFFIFQHADFLTTACTNSILKSIEEPPPGYHSIFLAENSHALAPTLKSRCIISYFFSEQKYTFNHELVPYFMSSDFSHVEGFLNCLEKTTIDEQTTISLLNYLLQQWMINYKKSQDKTLLEKIEIVHIMLQKPPMPGSGKIFWKNLFLQLHT